MKREYKILLSIVSIIILPIILFVSCSKKSGQHVKPDTQINKNIDINKNIKNDSKNESNSDVAKPGDNTIKDENQNKPNTEDIQKPDQDAHQEDQKPNEEGKQNEDQNSNSEQDIVRPSNYIEFQDGNFTNRLVMDENGKIKITKNTAKFLFNPFRYNDSGIKDIYLLDKNLKIEKNKIFVINPYKKPEDSYKVTYKFDGFKDINGKSELVIYVEKKFTTSRIRKPYRFI